MKTKSMIACALFAAIISIFAVMTIPIGIVPITMGLFGIMLTGIVLGYKNGIISVVIYLLIGIVGLPVFSNFRTGIQTLAGPTGGYLWSYIIMVWIIGVLTVKLPKNKWLAWLKIFAACLMGIVVSYAAGTIQFMLVQRVDLIKALTLCVIPFIPFDILKAIIATYVGSLISKTLRRANLLPESHKKQQEVNNKEESK